MSKGKGNRVYWRRQSKAGAKRAYGDFRDFADVGGRQEALIPPGTKRATDDPLVAEVLAGNRVVELQERGIGIVVSRTLWAPDGRLRLLE